MGAVAAPAEAQAVEADSPRTAAPALEGSWDTGLERFGRDRILAAVADIPAVLGIAAGEDSPAAVEGLAGRLPAAGRTVHYLLTLPVLHDCTGPHSSLPAQDTAEGVLAVGVCKVALVFGP